MYVMCHLLSGILLGTLLSRSTGDRRMTIACTLGAILPDLVDKPLGLAISGTIGYGRIYSHALVMGLFLLGIGVVLWAFLRRSTRNTGILIALSMGFLLHQILDAMWQSPATWFWPFMGPFPPGKEIEIIPYILADVLQPAEWLAGIRITVLFLCAWFLGAGCARAPLVAGLSLILGFAALWLVICALGGSFCPLSGWDSRSDSLIVAFVLLGGAICLAMEYAGFMQGGEKHLKNLQ
ncbi:MAG: metal-dependent hydrolase [Methanolinea sp.]|jgi:membrane-bound metal-dependent hydrolase YbcI (DUF457 family)|nr:metal-dependent hydrolase [Methanolinea sp.]